ncbi:hypothetical protein QFC24_001117 [Naganishia onofrii]|uniref:Uncharacterized protein n=1 Tax=Naganishia onofrii TaxID=1851511 RepID=A0ACC2XWQ7_9TREE|nr:hypothetical protein QFC24_001117 [Naganishia onofrii]
MERGKKTGNDNYALPRRQPHFDTASTAGRNSDDDDEMSIHYGGAGGGGGGDSSMRDDRSDAGYSVASSSARSRRVAQSYGDLYDTQASVGYRASPESTRGGGGRGRGSARGARGGRVADRFGDAPPTAAVSSQSTQRNQDGGRQIGRGAGRGRGGERGRGRGGQQQQQQARGAGTGRRQEQHQSRQQIPPPSANLPARPRDLSPTSAHIARVTSEAGSSNVQAQPQQQPQMQQASQGYNPMLGMSPFGWAPQAMGQMPMGMGMPGMPMGMPMGMMGGQMFSPYFAPQQQPQQQSQQSGGGGQQYPAQAQTQGQQGVPGMPAINPRFMQQYQQMMAQYQGQAQGQGQGQGGPQQQ